MLDPSVNPFSRVRRVRRFCGAHCANEFNALARRYALGLVEAGKLTVEDMHATVDRYRSSNMVGRNRKELIR
jgi:hypothetical protein